jgi:hypothetical protein
MGNLTLLCILGVIVCATPLQAAGQDDPRPIRTFAHFAGTWTLDEAASTGRLTLAPLKITIETTPAEIKVTKQQGPRYTQRFPPPEIYRMDGTETVDDNARPRAVRRFTLVADMLALTTKNIRTGDNGFTLQTEAYAVDRDVLTFHVQLVSVDVSGHVLLMQEPTNNFKHTFTYRRGDAK